MGNEKIEMTQLPSKYEQGAELPSPIWADGFHVIGIDIDAPNGQTIPAIGVVFTSMDGHDFFFPMLFEAANAMSLQIQHMMSQRQEKKDGH